MSEGYIAEVRLFAGTFAPVGWADCDGSLLNISEHNALYALIGTTYGGDAQTTFALPDLRGRVPLHLGQGAGLSGHTLGEAGGSETVVTDAVDTTEYTPAVSVRKSLASKDHIISMIDGKPYRTLRRHLSTHGLTPDEYRARYKLKPDYPMVAPAYSEARRAMAKKIGLGRKPKTPAETTAASAVPARKPRRAKGAVTPA